MRHLRRQRGQFAPWDRAAGARLTVEQIGDIVRSGEDVRVIDADGNDETAEWLLAWLRRRAHALPKPVLHALVRGVRADVKPLAPRRERGSARKSEDKRAAKPTSAKPPAADTASEFGDGGLSAQLELDRPPNPGGDVAAGREGGLALDGQHGHPDRDLD